MALPIPNPKKSFQVEFPIEKVQRAIENIHLTHDNLTLVSSQPVLNLYTFSAIEDGGLNLGIFADINLNAVAENRTEINIEIRRKIGTFNKTSEIFKANIHLNNIYTGISKVITLNDSELEKLVQEKEARVNKKKQTNKKLYKYVLLPLVLLIVLLMAFVSFIG